MVTVDDTVTRPELDECLAHLNAEAKRCLFGSTRWDDIHQVMNLLLDKRETCDGR